MEVKKLTEFSFEIPKRDGMKVPGIVYASEKLMKNMVAADKSIRVWIMAMYGINRGRKRMTIVTRMAKGRNITRR